MHDCVCVSIILYSYFPVGTYISVIYLSLWCLNNPEFAQYLNECHFGLHNCQPHANTVSGSAPKWDESTRVNGGLLGFAESTAKEKEPLCV